MGGGPSLLEFLTIVGGGMGTLIGAVLLVVAAGCWLAAGPKARIYNKIHGTSFTRADFFWAENQINEGSRSDSLSVALRDERKE